MSIRFPLWNLLLFATVAVSLMSDSVYSQYSQLNQVKQPTADGLRAGFDNPGRNYATAPLWVWNDLLTEDQIRSTLQDLAASGVKQAFVHPRPGLMTPYLSDDWFRLWRVALDEAEKLDMNIWIYDENSYPSGFAGGNVPDQMPESRGKGLSVVSLPSLVNEKGLWSAGADVMYVTELTDDGKATDRTAEVLAARDAGKPIPALSAPGRWVVGRYIWAGTAPRFGGRFYVDLLKPGVTDKFIEITHEAYKRNVGDQFGKRLPGLFTDEPQITPAGHLSWTDDLPEVFQKRFGYSLIENLNLLVEETGDWKKVRHNYYQVLLELFVERWSKPNFNWCEANSLEYTGHYWEHGWPNAGHGPDNMAMYTWHQRPAIDLLTGLYTPRDSGAQFGNVRSGRELGSVAHQLGRSRTLSENYGAGGWDIRFEDLKRLGDWSYAVGVNTTDEHLSYITIRGARKHDHPQSFSYHASWFPEYKALADYLTRLSYIMSQGQLSRNRFLLIEPTTTAWLYQRSAKLGPIGGYFANLSNDLEALQADYDLGSEDIIARLGDVDKYNSEKDSNEKNAVDKNSSEKAVFVVGKARYDRVVLSDYTENLNLSTVTLLAEFARNGGEIVRLGKPFDRVDGLEIVNHSAEVQKLAQQVIDASVEGTVETLAVENQRVRLIPQASAGETFHMLRETNDALILFICNTSMTAHANGKIQLDSLLTAPGRVIEQFDPATGTISPYNQTEDGQTSYDLPPCGSIVLVFSAENKTALAGDSKKADSENTDPVVITMPSRKVLEQSDGENVVFATKVLDDNVLVLDYMDIQIGAEKRSDEYFFRADSWLWQKNGYAKSPWDRGVQLKDELIKREFPQNSGFTVSYRFQIDPKYIAAVRVEEKASKTAAAAPLRFVCEYPDGYTVSINGKQLSRIPGAWKFDRSFGVYDITSDAIGGENVITLKAERMTMFHEQMPAWIIGDFILEPAEKGFLITTNRPVETTEANSSDSKDSKEFVLPHSNGIEGVAWLSAGVDFTDRIHDRAPSITFTTGQPSAVAGFRVWNYCEVNLPHRGVKEFDLTADGKPVSTISLKRGSGKAETILFDEPITASSWKWTIRSNHGGVSYPLPESFHSVGNSQDNAFVGLAEVQLLTRTPEGKLEPVGNVKASASSELVFRNHNRRAAYAVNGSGLGLIDSTVQEGWASMGMPFYSGAVDYSYSFRSKPIPTSSPVYFTLPPVRQGWNGAVAVVFVNGKRAGSILCMEDKVEISDLINRTADDSGQVWNTITVRIYGTPKNMYGPHHAGRHRGSAWPGNFHGAPQGTPSGYQYDVIQYGLF